MTSIPSHPPDTVFPWTQIVPCPVVHCLVVTKGFSSLLAVMVSHSLCSRNLHLQSRSARCVRVCVWIGQREAKKVERKCLLSTINSKFLIRKTIVCEMC